MTLEEAIKHAEEKAKRGGKCGEDHAQLAEWLKELQKLRTVKTEKRKEESAQNVPKEDLISRKAAIEAHYEYCNKHPDAGFPVWSLKILEDLPSAQPAKRTEERTETHACDSISRQAAIDALQKEIDKWTPPFDHVIGAVRCGVRLARNIIEDLPSVQPKRETGNRLRISGEQEYVCQKCGQRCLETIMLLPKWDYCPNCGAYMGGADE